MGETNWVETWKIDTLNMMDWTWQLTTTSSKFQSKQKAKQNKMIRLVQGFSLVHRLVSLTHNLYQPCYCCLPGHQYVGCVRIMRWRCSSLGKWPHPYLVSAVNCYVATPFFLNRSTLIRPPPDFPLGGGCPYPPLATLLSTSVVQPHRIICPPDFHLSPSRNTNTHCSSPHILTRMRPFFLFRSFHAFRITSVAPLLLPKYT